LFISITNESLYLGSKQKNRNENVTCYVDASQIE